MTDIDLNDPVLQRLQRRIVFFELLMLTAVAAVFITAVHLFVVQPFITSGDSMAPTFDSGEYLVIDEISYYSHTPERGDVVVFRYPLDPSVYFIKRLIGVPGDTVTIKKGVVSVQTQNSSSSVVVQEFYVTPANKTLDSSTITLTSDEYFVLGDNRAGSFDSRLWGPVPRRYIIGEPILRLFPLQKLALWPGQSHASFSGASSSVLSTAK